MTSPAEGPRLAGPDDDATLVARALGGERAAHRTLYDRYRPGAWRVARGFADLDVDEVDDVVQEAFVRAFRSLASLKDPRRFGPWVLTIARNRALSRLTRRRAAVELREELTREVEVAQGESAPDPDGGIEVELVRQLIAELPEGPEKETVHLFYVEGELSARQIAERLGVGKSAITMRLERFRTKVKRRLLVQVARLGERRSRR